ncbi:MAG: type II secretion system ATPase GspE [Deltaproteobacteria bacterium]|nr:type II secretion system ATPase GspE [Deltaproteobacteria bacterium]
MATEKIHAAQSRQKIGEILLRTTSLTGPQLKEALEIQAREGGVLGEILLRKNFVMPHEILKALCAQLDLPFVEDLKPNDIDAELVKNIPINYAKTKEVLPLARYDGTLMVAVSNPFNMTVIEDLHVLTGCQIQIMVSTSARIQDAINRVYERATANLITDIKDEFEESYDLEGPIDILDASEHDAPVIKFVNSAIFRAVKERASDIHVEPYEKEMVIRFRIDGVLYDILRQPKRPHSAIISRIKVMGVLDIAEKRLPQDGRIKIKLAGKDIDIRLSTIPTAHGERAVLRLLEQGEKALELPQLGFSGDTLMKIERLIGMKHGIMLVTGPTGHGKSTTLTACLTKLNNPERCIITVEDPIEYVVSGVNQIQVNAKIDLTFARALRSILRQNPDVIMIGEIRDRETAEIAVNASLTGHLVLSTLHTNDSAGAPPRLLDMGVEPFLVASSLLGIIAQRLIRKVCLKCRLEYEPTDVELEELGVTRAQVKGGHFYKAVGCPSCSGSGYSGRTVAYEIMVIDDEIRQLIVKESDGGSIKKKAVEKGMKTLREDGVAKVMNGITTIEELLRATQADEE